MSLSTLMFRLGAGRSDRKRDKLIPLPGYTPKNAYNEAEYLRCSKEGV